MSKQHKKFRQASQQAALPAVDVWADFRFARKDWISSFLLSLFILAVYLALPCKAYFFDGIMYAAVVDGREPNWENKLFWSNHMTFNLFGRIFWRLGRALGLPFGADGAGYSALATMNSFFGAAVVGLFFLWLKKLKVRSAIAILFTGALAFSYTFWWRATDAQVYPPHIFLLLLCWMLTCSYARAPTKGKLALLALLISLAINTHQMNIFYVPVVVYAIWKAHAILRERWRRLLALFAIGILCVPGFYIWVIVRDGHFLSREYMEALQKTCSPEEVRRAYYGRNVSAILCSPEARREAMKAGFKWILGNAGSYNTQRYTNPFWSMDADKLFFIGKDPKNQEFKITLLGFNLVNLWVDVRTMFFAIWYQYPEDSSRFRWSKILVQIVFSLVAVGFFILGRKRWDSLVAKTAFLWFLPHLLIVTWWNPGNSDYWYQFLIPLYTLMALSLSKMLEPPASAPIPNPQPPRAGLIASESPRQNQATIARGPVAIPFLSRVPSRAWLAGTCLSLASIPILNFSEGIFPRSREYNNKDLSIAKFIDKNTPKEAVILISGVSWNPGKVYIPSYAHRPRLSLDLLFVYSPKEEALAQLRESLVGATASGTPFFMLSEVDWPFTRQTLLEKWAVTRPDIDRILEAYQKIPRAIYEPGMQLLELRPKPGSLSLLRRNAILAYSEGRYKEAREICERIVKAGEASASEYDILGRCYLMAGRVSESVAAFEKSLRFNPNNPNAQALLGQARAAVSQKKP